MNLNELHSRIARWEDLRTEFKEWPVHSDDLAAALTAFANTDGGQLILGVNKARQIVGVADADRAMQSLDSIAYQNCEPPLTIVQETVQTVDGLVVVVVNVPKGDQRPYRTNRGVYYTRISSGRRQTSRQELLRLFQATESMFYDESPVLRATVEDIDFASFARFIERYYSQRPEDFPTGYHGCCATCAWRRRSPASCIPRWPACSSLAASHSASCPMRTWWRRASPAAISPRRRPISSASKARCQRFSRTPRAS